MELALDGCGDPVVEGFDGGEGPRVGGEAEDVVEEGVAGYGARWVVNMVDF